MTEAQSRQDTRPWVKPALMLAIFLVALLPRALYPVSRPVQWYTRSVMFVDRVLKGSWGETVYSEHPGVTTMWLSGIALRLAGEVPEQRPEGPYVDPAWLTARESRIGVAPLAFVIALLTVLAYRLLARLFDEVIALAAGLLVALDPFTIANSQVLHIDGLLVAFASSSALAMLVFVKERRWRWLVLSGALAGLAMLTKATALFLVPYAGLALLVAVIADRAVRWRRDVLAGLVWLLTLVLVYFALFPAMWVAPLKTLRAVYGLAAVWIKWPHAWPIYYAGRMMIGDPGPMYYLHTWAYKVTAVVAVFGVLALAYSIAAPGWPRHQRVTTWMVAAFALFFTLQMMLGAKKMPRYLLPAWPMADILGGVGLVVWARQVARLRLRGAALWKPTALASDGLIRSDVRIRVVSAALVVGGLLVQAALILPRHPYYDTYFNELAGGARAGVTTLSTQWQGEGLDLAARRLNALPDAEQRTVASHRAILFRQYFVGQTVDVEAPAELVVLGLHNVLKGGEEGEEAVVDFYRRREAQDTVAFDNIPYVSIYASSSEPQNQTRFAFEPSIQLGGFDIATTLYRPGETVRLQLYWQTEEQVPEDYVVFVHLLDAAGQLIAQQDNQPVHSTRPTSTWEPGAVIVDPYDITIPPDALPGEYTIAIGLYRWPELTRLTARDAAGAQLPDDRVLLTTLRIEAEPPATAMWIARGLALLVVLLGAAAWQAADRRV